MATWVKAPRAYSICDRCGFAYKYSERHKELSGIFVCNECYDGDFQILNHPGNFPAPFRPDAPLKSPRPDVVMDTPVSLPYGTWE